MKEKIKKYWWILIIIVVAGTAFYWFQWRPAEIRKECAAFSQGKENKFNLEQFLSKYGSQEARDNLYKNCLREHGLEK